MTMYYHLFTLLSISLFVSEPFATGDQTENCTFAVAEKCATYNDATWVQDMVNGNWSFMYSLDINTACSGLDDVFHCIGKSYHGCNYVFRLAYYTVVEAGRYICNTGKQGFIDNVQCLLNPNILPSLKDCTIDLMQNYPDLRNSTLDDKKDEICGLYGTWGNCMVKPVKESCSNAALDYVANLVEATFKPMRYVSLCKIGSHACLSSPCQNGGICLRSYYEFWNYTCDCLPGFTGRNCEQELNPTTSNVIPETTEPIITPICDMAGTLQCLKTVSESQQNIQIFATGNFYNITEIDTLCQSMKVAELCVGSKLDGCSEGVRLLRDVIIAGARHICINEERSEFVGTLGCFSKLHVANVSWACMGGLINEFGKYFSGEMDVFTDSKHFCNLIVTWIKCYMGSVRTLCSSKDYSYMYRYVNSSNQPIKDAIGCDVLASLPAPTANTGLEETTSSLDNNQCDWTALQCFIPSNGGALQMFATGIFINVTYIDQICKDLEDVYFCIGSRLDGCSSDVLLLRDVILAGSRYICNQHKTELVSMSGCFNQLAARNITLITCMKDKREELGKYFTGQKNVFDNVAQFCSLITIWVECFLGSVSSHCGQREYAFMYHYMENAYKPLTTSLGCDVLSVMSIPTTQIALTEFETEPFPEGEPEPTPEGQPEPTPEGGPEPTAEGQPEPTPEGGPEPTPSGPGKDCLSSPCYNGGSCIQLSAGYECKCLPNMVGSQCQIGVGGCPGFPCYNGGSCYADDNGHRCFCPSDFPGEHCEGTVMTTDGSALGECISSPCFNGGTCIPRANGYECSCPPNLFGSRCELGVGGCPGFPCYNGGSCQTDNNGHRCLCPSDFPGEHCEGMPTTTVGSALGECISSPCFNGGSCIPRPDGYECSCPSNLYGSRCEMGNGDCPGFPCHNGGTCITDENGPKCLCTSRYTGLNCEYLPITTTVPTTTPVTTTPETSQPNWPRQCKYIISYHMPRKRLRQLNRRCTRVCNKGTCPPSCKCNDVTENELNCYPIGVYRNMLGMKDWCNNNCNRNYCPSSVCKCTTVSKG